MLRVEACSTFPKARQREAQLKGWSRAKKEALNHGDLRALSALSESRETRAAAMEREFAMACWFSPEVVRIAYNFRRHASVPDRDLTALISFVI